MISVAIFVATINTATFVDVLIPPLVSKVPNRDAVALAFLLSFKGIVELISYTKVRDNKRFLLIVAICEGSTFPRTYHQYHLSLAMLFFGGSDDRKALSLTKCMSQKSIISLTMVCIIAKNTETS
ncbi:hypothetical protein Patl1_14416 [Pistacia atlantica]|uniref:Uncharacterized protein n=1 Tax=Pistacia atlantica TaxID=434234 RepID=A0ACC1AT48_9ROSI|nr:hypothetical protein Patl1_14416 [Pistacia atlantica]